MSKFRYYITETVNGDITGTNDEAVARDLAKSEDNFVVDAETGQWLMADDDEQSIRETRHEVPEPEPEEEEEDDEDEDLDEEDDQDD
jgi:hypothetical protein